VHHRLDLFKALQARALSQPDTVALTGGSSRVLYGKLPDLVSRTAAALPGQRIGILMDNHPAWAVADLAVLLSRRVCVPLPTFFSDAQLRHAIQDACLDTVITDQPGRLADLPLTGQTTLTVAGQTLHVLELAGVKAAPLADDVVKVTYTSGTTSRPKGVCLTWSTLQAVVHSLVKASEARVTDHILALLPMSTLLENIGSVYVPLQVGATAVLVAPEATGLRGSQDLDVPTLLACLQRYQPSGLILIPQLLQILVAARQQGTLLPGSLRFIAVGGAPVARGVLDAAHRAGLPVFQGYGLSEAGSVVCLNTARHNRPGSVGRHLPHVDVRIAADGEIHIRGSLFSGYLGEPPRDPEAEYATGDVGWLDEDGYLYLTGRKKHMFITSFGRNVSPDWIECELQGEPAIAQAAVFGEARPFNVAVIVPRGKTADQVRSSINVVNQRLPDYAWIRKFVLAGEAFTPHNNMLTANGRLRRASIANHYRQSLDDLYNEEVA
jgi:long-chain acyl-CoA synthetase